MGYLQHFMVIVQDFLFGAIKLEFAWILAREKHLDPEMVRNMPIKSCHKYSLQEIFYFDSVTSSSLNIHRKKYFTLTLSPPPA